ncbi:hypothetical protein CJ030_MR0G027028 [Morella rubra]|uniref:Thioredoxin-like protein AAED1, chloroplastic n=1 Tax=Morella rubra TaxID=262757 RepID=A0A6A1UG71_9ROSI|nr:hypothetical protein CJ030_MR0G027028 [Morella rubra]
MSSSTSEFVPKICDILGNVTIFKASGEPILFENLWDQNQGVAVVALLRHFGCPCCYTILLYSTLEWILLPDVQLPFPVDCLYVDPDRKAYEVLGLYYGVGRTFFNPASVFSRFESLRKAVKNYMVKATPDDKSSVLQQGGIFVFKGKQLLYARKDEGTGDHAPLDDIFDACCKVPVG